MTSVDPNERFSRQVILPLVGPEGQKKWSEASVLLAGEGPALQSATTALASSGVQKLYILSDGVFDTHELASAYSNLQIDVLPEKFESLPAVSAILVLTEHKKMRQTFSRWLRHHSQPAVFGWVAGKGIALFASHHKGGQCPCLECFEVMNPKAFGSGDLNLQRMVGAMAASEVLQQILNGKSPLVGKVWITSLETGVSFHHEVQPTYKCPARMMEEGAAVTP
jgi:hypothetical protein